jgi:hypothetical protein
MTSSSPALVVGLFERELDAREAARVLGDRGVRPDQLGLLAPGFDTAGQPTGLLQTALVASEDHDLSEVLAGLGLPDGEARFYASEASQGRTLLVVDADGRFDAVRQVVLERGGYDVRSRGRDLARADGAGVAGGTGPRPLDVTGNWEDVRSRYEMLWQQHYGTTDATWDTMEPLYQYGWRIANDARYRGRPWSSVEAMLRADWRSNPPVVMSWEDAAGPLRDLWEDVAEEAATGAEGGADRRIARQGTDQSISARDVDSAESVP